MQIVPVSLQAKIAALRKNAYFATLSQEVLEEISQGVTLVRYTAGENVCWQDEPCSGLYLLHKGNVKLYKLSARGRELIIRTLSPGATFNEVPVFDHGTNPVNVAALTEAEIWVVQAEVIRRALERHPEMAQAVIVNLSKNLRTLVGLVEELSFYQVIHRLARLLTRLSAEELAQGRITQERLAAQLGTVREVVARSLRILERSGAIQMERGRIRIADAEALQHWTNEPC